MEHTQSNSVGAIANETPTSKAIFKALAERQRFRRRTDLNRLHKTLGDQITEEEFLSTFKKLQEAGIGSLIIGRKNNPNRFAWNYNLKSVANAALSVDGWELEPLPMKPRKRRVTKNKRNVKKKLTGRRSGPRKAAGNHARYEEMAPRTYPHVPSSVATPVAVQPAVQLIINLPASAKREDVEALVSLAKDLGAKSN
jgi:hypothetical protein